MPILVEMIAPANRKLDIAEGGGKLRDYRVPELESRPPALPNPGFEIEAGWRPAAVLLCGSRDRKL
jgi:hypothetical protein